MSLWVSQVQLQVDALSVDLKIVQVLVWPTDKAIIASLSLEEKICWYSGQNPRQLIFLGQDSQFKAFWKRHYLLPLHIKRLLYRIKNVLRTAFKS